MGRLQEISGKFRRLFTRAADVPRVLIAEDDESVRVLCAAAVMRAGFMPETAADGREALTKLEEGDFDYVAVLLDLGMPFVHGSTLVNVIEKRRPDLLRRLIVMTGAHEAALDSLFGRVAAVLRKPVTVDQIQSAVRSCTMRETMIAATAVGEATLRVN